MKLTLLQGELYIYNLNKAMATGSATVNMAVKWRLNSRSKQMSTSGKLYES
jgi:hypothetical protein